jgi:drug/metabolite transporter (DMT)-like permease
MNHNLITALFGLAASLSWGSGDFSGGLATRRVNVFTVVVAAHAIGLVLLIALALAWSEPFPSALDMAWGSAAGLAGAVGIVSFYQALAVGRMGINAPVTAVLAAALPVLFSVFFQGLPGLLQLAGFTLALIAVWLISRPERARGRPEGGDWLCWQDLVLAVSSSSLAEPALPPYSGPLPLRGFPPSSSC